MNVGAKGSNARGYWPAAMCVRDSAASSGVKDEGLERQ